MKIAKYTLLIICIISLIVGWQSCAALQSQAPDEQPLLGFRAYVDKAEWAFSRGDYALASAGLDTAMERAEAEKEWVWLGRISSRYVQWLALAAANKTISTETMRAKTAQIMQKLAEKQTKTPVLKAYIMSNKNNISFNPDSAVFYAYECLAVAEKEQEWALAVVGNVALMRYLYAQNKLEELDKLAQRIEAVYSQQLAKVTKKSENEDKKAENWVTVSPSLDAADYYNIQFFANMAKGDSEASGQSLEKLISMLENSPNPPFLPLINGYNNLADLAEERKDYRHALSLREKSVGVFAQKNRLEILDSAMLASAWVSIAHNYLQIGNRKISLQLVNKAIWSYENLDYSSQEQGFVQRCMKFLCAAYVYKTEIHTAQQQPDSSKIAIEKAKKYVEKTATADEDISTVQIYKAEIDLYLQQKNPNQALKIVNGWKKWQKDKKEISIAYLLDFCEWAGKTALQNKQPLNSLEYSQKQFLLIQNTDKNLTYAGLIYKNLFFVPDFDSLPNKFFALTAATQQLQSLAALAAQDSSYWGRDSFLQSYWQAALLTTRLFDYNLIHLNSQKPQADFILNLYTTYDKAMEIGAYLQQKTADSSYLNQVWHWSEQCKAVFLLQTLREGESQRFAGVPDTIVQKEAYLRRSLVYYQQAVASADKADTAAYNRIKTSLNRIESEESDFRAGLKADFPKYQALKQQVDFVQMAEIQAIIPDSAQMLSFWVGNEFLYIFAIDKTSRQLQKYPLAPAQKLLNELIPLYTNPNSELTRLKKLSFQLYKNYIGENIAADKNELLIIADGLFNYLPFEALLTAENDKKSPREWDYLLQKYKISYHYSASLYQILQTRESQASNWQILGMAAAYQPTANPYAADSILAEKRTSSQKIMRQNLAPLKAAVDEIARLPELYRGYFLLGETATETEFVQNAPYYGILHLAMHSVVDSENAEQSALIFAENGDTLNDNFLQSYEIKGLDLAADLVILSACETGFARCQRGEGVISVGRSFIYAGASSLLMSLWSLNDNSSPVIAGKFYEYLQQGFSKTEALQRAKLDYLQTAKDENAHPALWAALVQTGNTVNISPSRRITIWWYFIPVGAVVFIGWWARNALKQRRKF